LTSLWKASGSSGATSRRPAEAGFEVIAADVRGFGDLL